MIETSDFVQPPSEVSSSETFEKITELQHGGQTSQAYIVRKNGKQFFMKQLKPKFACIPVYRSLFIKEYEVGVSLSHPNIVHYEHLESDVKNPYILMEYISGQTLEQKIKNAPAYFTNKKNLEKFFSQLLQGLKCLHDHNILHCDIKPQNIMITQINNDVKIIDLGFCYTDKYDYTAGHTNEFSAPEQKIGTTNMMDVRTDIYNVGQIIKYLDNALGKGILRKYRMAMNKCLETEMEKRFQNTDEIIAFLTSQTPNRIAAWAALAVSVAIIFAFTYNLLIIKNIKTAAPSSSTELVGSYSNVSYHITSIEEGTCEVITGETFPNITIEDRIRINNKVYKVREFADSAFYQKDKLQSLHIPMGIERIGAWSIACCENLKQIDLPESVSQIDECAFSYCTNLDSVRLPANVKEIPKGCFHHSAKLKKIIIPEGVTKLGADAFAFCTALEEVVLPSGLESIGAAAFYECRSMKEITIPATVHTIESFAFFGCESLTHVYNHSPKPQQILRLFNIGNIVVHVPKGSETLYAEDENWRQYQVVGDLNTTSNPS